MAKKAQSKKKATSKKAQPKVSAEDRAAARAARCANTAVEALKELLVSQKSDIINQLIRGVEASFKVIEGTESIPRDVRTRIAASATTSIQKLIDRADANVLTDEAAAEILLRRALAVFDTVKTRLLQEAVNGVQHNRVVAVLKAGVDEVIDSTADPVIAIQRFLSTLHVTNYGSQILNTIDTAAAKGKELAARAGVSTRGNLAEFVPGQELPPIRATEMVVDPDTLVAGDPDSVVATLAERDIEADPSRFVKPIRQVKPFDASRAEYNAFANKLLERIKQLPPKARNLAKNVLAGKEHEGQLAILAGMQGTFVKDYVFANEAFSIGRILREESDAILADAKEAGLPVNIIDNWIFQSHDVNLILANPQAWKRWVIENNVLDPVKHPDIEATTEAVLTRLAEKDFQVLDNTIGELRAPSRQLWFNDFAADGSSAIISYMREWGGPTPLLSTLRALRKLVLAKNMHAGLGPYPTRAVAEVKAHIRKRLAEKTVDATLPRGSKDLARIEGAFRSIDIVLNEEAGLNDIVATGRESTALVFEGLRGWLASGLLSNTFLFSIFSDPVFAATHLSQSGLSSGFADSVNRLAKSMASIYSEDELRRLVNSLGVHGGFANASALMRMMANTNLEVAAGGKWAQKFAASGQGAAKIVFKATGVDAMARGLLNAWSGVVLADLKRALAETGATSLNQLRGKEPALDVFVSRMEAFGINDDMIAAWTKAAQESQFEMLDFMRIEDVHARTMLLGFLQAEHRNVIASPDSFTRAFVKGAYLTDKGLAPARGTAAGEIARGFFGMQSMPLQLFITALGRSLALGLGATASMMLALATTMYLKMQLQQIALGKEPYRNPVTDPVAATALLDQMGVFWMFGTVARGVAVTSRIGKPISGGTLIESASGPMLPFIADSVSSQLQAGSVLLGDEGMQKFLDEEAKAISGTMINLVPFSNNILLNAGLVSLTGRTLRQNTTDFLGVTSSLRPSDIDHRIKNPR